MTEEQLAEMIRTRDAKLKEVRAKIEALPDHPEDAYDLREVLRGLLELAQ